MPPKKRPAGEDVNGEEPKKRAATAASTTSATTKSVSINLPGTNTATNVSTSSTAAAKPAFRAAGAATPKPAPARGAPKPGIRKVSAAAVASRTKLPVAGAAVIKKEAPPPIITKNTLMWFRNDLRLQDNGALHAASERARMAGSGGDKRYLIGLFIISTQDWVDHNEASVKIDFWLRNLVALKRSLDKLHIPLIVERASSEADVARIVESIVKTKDVSHVFWNTEYLADETARDAAVKQALEKHPGVYVEALEDQSIVPPSEIKSKTGEAYTSFVGFNNTWRTLVETNRHFLDLLPVPKANPLEAKQIFSAHFNEALPTTYPHSLDRTEIDHLYPAGEEVAHQKLQTFVQGSLQNYHITRDCIHEEGTMALIPYLSNGILSARQCVAAARASNDNKILVGSEGVQAWIKEIIWREFYRHIAVFFPRICKNQPFNLITENIRWSSEERKFTMWCQGMTGYPLIDASMRQLNATGSMHNRLRTLAACFLVKDLLINWQKGEKYFMQHLIDGDLPSNNGSWQWCASTGVECQPYFRSLNPVQLSHKFDPNGEYIRRWVPELKGLSEKQIHDPYHALSAKEFARLSYPKPIVDHADAKKKFVDEYKRMLIQK
ncbi:hypothetical protein BGZ99_008203 [Dissophora globulifera]|uniref:Photolyase/cryptochrome alpha/beta domain-containing protein n=1 Tax=Dissophora globulifera TaxID=979702 RepID=A0A9P6UPP2_9FUNG|nr:hypothetical protein BGZ99_008203 [Dissophora globulifera]